MARPLRIEYPGAVYHITNRGNERREIYKDDQDCKAFLDTLQQVKTRYNWLCHAYCLMGNHYHLLIETPDGNLSIGMRQLNGVYTQAYNRRHRRIGHLFQGRYKAIILQKDSHLLEVCRYVVLNPVRAGLVEKPGEWRWSSYAATSGKGKAHPCLTTDWILGQFDTNRFSAGRKYRSFVADGIKKESVFKDVKAQSILGEDDFADNLKDYVKGYRDIAEIPKSQRYLDRPDIGEIFRSSSRHDRDRRNIKIIEAVNKYGYTQREVADHIGMHFTSISRIVREAS